MTDVSFSCKYTIQLNIIYSFSYNTVQVTIYKNYNYISKMYKRTLRAGTLLNRNIYEANTLCQHSQTPIEHVQRGFEILMELKICLISHHTLTLYAKIECTLRVITLTIVKI